MNKIALVGTGPSLEETWGELLHYPVIMTMSRSLPYLLDKGIVPTYHVDIDPGHHKVPRQIHGSVCYLLGSSVHPDYFAVVPNAQRLSRIGVQAGDTAVLAAADLGFREIHCFGYDACSGTAGEPIVLGDKVYLTNDNLLGGITCFENACRSIPGIKVTVHGNGLLRAYLDHRYGRGFDLLSEFVNRVPDSPRKDSRGSRRGTASTTELRAVK